MSQYYDFSTKVTTVTTKSGEGEPPQPSSAMIFFPPPALALEL
ncbi:predicted protein [Sclerotinia sclerotiorum 1980 UF-70]|uniref:Uncharacterized protein n=1 Tax=Sclerotinia sclerotiorum (strain ATCC 18683 / 1980 / Ss-1) TaxID=665079 RepID=A7E5X3_SCLS1|nr:predicted protein [Sclerotinia sclerotiorum 1980 UF-70]EDN91295.1 predicted protein [Sclerotinia sclerotiorum 1980 UF-70]